MDLAKEKYEKVTFGFGGVASPDIQYSTNQSIKTCKLNNTGNTFLNTRKNSMKFGDFFPTMIFRHIVDKTLYLVI